MPSSLVLSNSAPAFSCLRRRRVFEAISFTFFAGAALITLGLLIGIFLFLLQTAVQAFAHISPVEFFTSTNWNPTSFDVPQWGIVSLFASTLLVSLAALGVALPVGLAIAIFLSEIAPHRIRDIVKPLVEMIASVPTVTIGVLGLLYVAPAVARVFSLSNGLNALTAALLVGVAALPTIASMSDDALSSVSKNLREASLALGASTWTTIRKVVIPAARSGLVAAGMLGFGRVVGETMIVLMVSGNTLAMPHSLLDPARPMTANIAIEIKEVVTGSVHWQALFAMGAVLFILTLVINVAADMLIRRHPV